VDERHFRKDLDVEQLAHEIYGIAYGYHFLRRLGDGARVERRSRAAFDRLLADARAS
jgi:hypothetical protein